MKIDTIVKIASWRNAKRELKAVSECEYCKCPSPERVFTYSSVFIHQIPKYGQIVSSGTGRFFGQGIASNT